MLSVGIDIGTTTISAVVYDIDAKRLVKECSLEHNSYNCTEVYFEQDVDAIMEKAQGLLYSILDSYNGIVSIGVTGQMHGIVYINSDGEAVSNLATWQDKRAEQKLQNGKSACELIREITGEKIATGYGIATHYYNILNGKVPDEAVGFCSIMDLFIMKICKLKKATTHASVASSFGLFDIKNGAFMTDKLSLLGIDKSFLPEVTADNLVIGKCREIPVYVAIGDNQASFLGSVGEDDSTLLVNIGTGSQVSMVSDYTEPNDELELRPFVNGKYLICGSALCGGYAYSMLEKFFRSYIASSTGKESPQYDIMYKLACEAYESKKEGLCVDTSFFGKRSNPDLKGSITKIDGQNLTPSALVLGTLQGMCDELCSLYECFPKKGARIVASGGAVRKNEILKRLIEDTFGMSVLVSQIKEDAAKGAALFCRRG